MRRLALTVLLLPLLASCRGDGGGGAGVPSPTADPTPATPAATATATATPPAEQPLWEGDRVSISLEGGCTVLLSLPRFDGLAKAVGQVCSRQEATLLASGHYVDELFRWRRLDFGGGVTGWLVDRPSSGAGQPVVALVARGAGPADGPYIAAGTPVEVAPPTPECLPVRTFPSTHPDYAQVIGQVCAATPAKAAADIRYRDEGLFWRRLEIDGASGRIVGWVTDGTLAGSQPRSVYDPAKETRPTPTPTPVPPTPTAPPAGTISPPTATPTNTAEGPIVKQLSVQVGGYIEMDGRYSLRFHYQLNRPSDGRWLLIVDSFSYCTDAAGVKLGAADGTGAIASQFSPTDRGMALTDQAGSVSGEFGAAFLVPDPSVPPPPPIRCTHVRVSVAHFPKSLWDDPAIRLTRDKADRLETFQLAAETSRWGE